MGTKNYSHDQVERIFSEAQAFDSETERCTFLERECAGDTALRGQIEDLLRVQREADSFLDRPALDGFPETVSVSLTDVSDLSESIGNYRLLQRLGEGGMGTVYMAEQTEPIHRRVAIKVIKSGMDSKQFAARFEAERQALAMMDHPNIAKVLDAGCTEDGKPYFVMELVKGVPITQFCDQNKLTTRQRLELFVPVCQAVQHAHQKGVIHRDLKPSNVIVALYDDRPVPKVIDFGVAKATNQRLTEKTLFTMVGQIVGTWEYMSPEQTVLNQLDVDTRSDVYSLGVLLYELLAGVPPIDPQRLRSAGLEETLRLIREEEPPKPSTRLSSLGQAATAAAGYRRTEKEGLIKSVRGDLDWVVMKALEKDRTRRYQTPLELAADIGHHMSDEPVNARAPSTWYRFQKYARRHRGLVASVASIFAVVLIALAVSVSARYEAIEQRELALKSLGMVKDYTMMLAMSGDEVDVQRAIAISRLVDPDAVVWEKMLMAQGALHRGKDDDAIAYLEAGLKIEPGNVSCKALLASTLILTADWSEAADLLDELRSVEPVTVEDFAFMSQAFLTEPEKCLEYADRAIELQDSFVARISYAEALVFRSLDTGDDSRLDEAIQHIDYVEERVQENPYVWVISLLAEAAAIQLSERQGKDAQPMRIRAEQHVRQLGTVPQLNIGRVMTGYYQNTHGTDDQSLAAWQRVMQTDSRGALYTATPRFMTRQRSPQALTWLEGDDSYSHVCRLLLQLNEPGGVDRLLEHYESKTKNQDIDYWLPLEFMLVLAAGNAEYIKQDAQDKLAAVSARMIDCRTPSDRSTLEFLAGEISEDQFVSCCEGSNVLKSHCHRVIGDLNLAQGNRGEAIKHYEQVVDLGILHGADYCWAKAYLRNMEDPHWPHWIDFGFENGGSHKADERK